MENTLFLKFKERKKKKFKIATMENEKNCSAALTALAGTGDHELLVPLIGAICDFSPSVLNKHLLCKPQRQNDPKSRFYQMHMIEIQQSKETENSSKSFEVTDNGFLPAYKGSIWWREVSRNCRSCKH